MKKQVFSIIISLSLTSSVLSAVSVSAETTMTPGSLARQIACGIPEESAAHPDGNNWVYKLSYQYEGVAVTCQDISVLKENGLNGKPIEWSEGYWSTYWHPGQTDYLVQPLNGFVAEFGRNVKYEYGEEAPIPPCNLQPEYVSPDEPVYVIYAPVNMLMQLEADLQADENATPEGIVFAAAYQPVEYWDGCSLAVYPKRDESLNEADFAALDGCSAHPCETSAWGEWIVEVTPEQKGSGLKTNAKYQALLDAIKSNSKVYSIVPQDPEVEDIMWNAAAHTSVKIEPLRDVPISITLPAGDADGDGIITLKDATAAMKQYNQTEILGEDGFMTAQQIENADLDGDGAVTAKDATYIQKYVNFNVVLEEPKTWEELIKK